MMNRKIRFFSWFKAKLIDNQEKHTSLEDTEYVFDGFKKAVKKLFQSKEMPKNLKNQNAKREFFQEGYQIYEQIMRKKREVSAFESEIGGTGILIKENQENISSLPISGDLVVVMPLTWQKLKQKNHSSLLEFGSKTKGVLVGPLALFNHDLWISLCIY
jgi:hypothetical protein